ncbi:hypothetical protein BDV41DRAFT_418789 [Aspergillus transmontanensis]|uniref:Uncharacterized protein n=1 Tax=Aspergillus transmontanensis TaxID=1034304 RepID=A0A5N6VMG7_9EURO|nr:hypothetical protein BDV41DRAFT_418789 [Aspergillus transmontanensis]
MMNLSRIARHLVGRIVLMRGLREPIRAVLWIAPNRDSWSFDTFLCVFHSPGFFRRSKSRQLMPYKCRCQGSRPIMRLTARVGLNPLPTPRVYQTSYTIPDSLPDIPILQGCPGSR